MAENPDKKKSPSRGGPASVKKASAKKKGARVK
jgi:hypothetical protein